MIFWRETSFNYLLERSRLERKHVDVIGIIAREDWHANSAAKPAMTFERAFQANALKLAIKTNNYYFSHLTKVFTL